MKVFAYHAGNNGVSWYRVIQPMKYLARIPGFEVDGLPLRADRVIIPMEGKSNVPGIGSHSSITESADLIFSQFRADYENTGRMIWQAEQKPMVIDIDDDIWNVDETLPSYKMWKRPKDQSEQIVEVPEGQEEEYIRQAKELKAEVVRHEGKMFLVKSDLDLVANVQDQLKAAALVTVSTPRLKRLVSFFNRNVEVVPNSIDFEYFKKSQPNIDDTVRIGLFGSNTHYKDWHVAADAIKRILKEFPKARLCINYWLNVKSGKQGDAYKDLETTPNVADYFSDFINNNQVEMYQPSEMEDWAGWLAEKNLDIVLAPLADTIFNKSKSNLRYLEYSALGVPGIYQDLEPFNSDIEHGVNGFLADKPIDYYKFLKRMIENPKERKQMGNRARLDVEKRYDQAKTSAQLAKLLTNLKERTDEKAIADRCGLVLVRH